MLPKINRLHKESEIKRLMQTGRAFFLPQFTFKYKITKQPEIKIAFVVSNKVSKKAVVRNLLKRRLRNATKDFLAEAKPGHQLAIIAKPSALKLDYPTIKKQLQFAFKKIKII